MTTTDSHAGILGNNPALRRVLELVDVIAETDATVLIMGETGTGKELIARAIHRRSRRADQPLVTVNCGAVPRELFESEFFGHARGSFTGAIRDRSGRFQLAHRGTIFLDEVGELPLELQPKLLRVLQERQFESVGDNTTHHVDVRVVAATHRDLHASVAEGRFREDLFYRLNVVPLEVPPLRARKDDIPLLAADFVSRLARRLGLPEPMLTDEICDRLVGYDWPGNVRELENVLQRAVILSQDVPVLQLPPFERRASGAPPAEPTPPATLEGVARTHILATLRETNGIVGGPLGAAARLGVKRTTLQTMMRRLGIGTWPRRWDVSQARSPRARSSEHSGAPRRASM